MTDARLALERMVRAELAQPVPAGVQALTDRLRERYGDELRGVVLYGSCLRRGDDRDGVVDLYALVRSYRSAHRSAALATINRLLPPNVFYLEAELGQRVVRCKYAVLASDDLERLTSARTSEPYFWARFAQPCALVYAADDRAREAVVTAFAGAIATFVHFAVPLSGEAFDARELWTTGWRATYRAELRPERPQAAALGLYDDDADRYERATALAVETLPWSVASVSEGDRARFRVALPPDQRWRAVGAWRLRRVHAKLLFLLRILRNALIFEGGIDYVLWKIQRHSGVEIDHTWRRKRHRYLALGAEAWRLYRARAFR